MAFPADTHHSPTASSNHATIFALNLLPSELLLTILSHLDIPDLLSISRTCHTLRTLSLDPLLHTTRLHRASLSLSHNLQLRPSLAELMAHRIYITRTTLAARNLGRNLIKIKLNRQLLRRPSAERLVEMGVLPRECVVKGRGIGEGMAPGLVGLKRKVERERVKDELRGWVEEWRRKGWEERRRMDEMNGSEGKPDVRRLVRRFARDRNTNNSNDGRQRWGGNAERRREDPTRAKVLGLKRFWEKVGRGDVTN